MASEKEKKLLTAIVIGAGNRGETYANFALDFPDRLQIVGVADPKPSRRALFQRLHQLSAERVLADWSELVGLGRIADVAIVTTPDALHKEPAVACMSKGYHVLLEKPIAVTIEDCKEIVAKSIEHNVILTVCHVLKYFPAFKAIKDLITSGTIGDVVNIQHTEPVGYWHFAHSYVRGNWNNEEQSTFSLLAKCCHDVDILRYWMGNHMCLKVSSFGSLHHFRKENKPDRAGSRCLDCSVESSCPYSAKKIYLDKVRQGHKGWPVCVLNDEPDIENITQALQSGPYGRCVYDCDNDVCDNQVVNFQFEGDRTASLTMVAFTERVCQRSVKIYGTKGELTYMNDGSISIFDFNSGKLTVHDPKLTPSNSRLMGHNGADFFLMKSFIDAVANNDPSLLSGPEDFLASHLLVFAAEASRKQGRVITVHPDYSFS